MKLLGGNVSKNLGLPKGSNSYGNRASVVARNFSSEGMQLKSSDKVGGELSAVKVARWVRRGVIGQPNSKRRLWFLTLSFYAILRSIPHKAAGIVAMGGAILVMLVIPYTYTGYIRNTTYRPLFKIFYWLLVADFLALMWIGQAPITDPFILLGQLASVYYFSFFIVLIPLIGIIHFVLCITYLLYFLKIKKIYV